MPSSRDAAGDVNDAGGAEVGPGKFLLTSPDQLDRLAGRFGQAGGFDGGLAGVFAAVTRAGVGHDDANVLLGDAKGFGQLGADAEGTLRAGPDGQLAVLPLRHGGARFQRRVGDVGDGVSGLQFVRGRLKPVLDRAGALRRRRARSPRPPASLAFLRR